MTGRDRKRMRIPHITWRCAPLVCISDHPTARWPGAIAAARMLGSISRSVAWGVGVMVLASGAAESRRHPRDDPPPSALWILANGTPVIIRPICPADEPLMAQFHRLLSPQSVYRRYFHAIRLSTRIDHARLLQICRRTDVGETALVAEHTNPQTGVRAILAIGRSIRLPDHNAAEFALLIGDSWQRQGLGRELLRRLVTRGRMDGVRWMLADILPENRGMRRICAVLGFQQWFDDAEAVIKVRLDLAGDSDLPPQEGPGTRIG